MAWDPSRPGLGEATRLWIIAAIVADLGRLNTALSRDNLLKLAVPASAVMRGDPDTLPAVTDAPILFCVSGGGDLGADMDINQKYVPLIYKHEIFSQISVYLHPKTLPQTSGNAKLAQTETIVDRCCDWLRGGVFNTLANVSGNLLSQEYGDPAGDRLSQCHVKAIKQGWTTKGFAGADAVYYGRLVHAAWIAGKGY